MQEYVEIVSGGYTLRGFLHRPDPQGKRVPAVILFHGYSANKSNGWFVELARRLEERGFACLRFDFMGSGDSDGRFEEMSIETEISDGLSILRYAHSLACVDENRIGLAGVSFGGLAAAILAGRQPALVRALCLCCPAIIAIKDAREGRAGRTDITSALTEGTADVDGLLVGRRFLEDTQRLDFETEAARYGKRTLLIWGDRDPIVPPDIISRCENVYGDRLQKLMIQGVGHMFETRPARVRLMDETVAFFERELSARDGCRLAMG